MRKTIKQSAPKAKTANLNRLGLDDVSDPLPPDPTPAQDEAQEAEQKRWATLPKGWNAVKDLVLETKKAPVRHRYVWHYYVSWFPKKGQDSEEGMMVCPSFANAERVSVVLNQCGAVPAWL